MTCTCQTAITFTTLIAGPLPTGLEPTPTPVSEFLESDYPPLVGTAGASFTLLLNDMYTPDRHYVDHFRPDLHYDEVDPVIPLVYSLPHPIAFVDSPFIRLAMDY